MGCCPSKSVDDSPKVDDNDKKSPPIIPPDPQDSQHFLEDNAVYMSRGQTPSASRVSSRPSTLEPLHISGIDDVSDQIVDLSERWMQSTSTAYLYTGHLEGSQVAIKIIKLPALISESYERLLQVWATLQHKNVVNVLGYYIGDLVVNLRSKHPAMVYPWFPDGNIRQYIASRNEEITEEERIQLIEDVAEGVDYLHTHSPSIVHGNLKPENILVDEEGVARIVDFGISSLEAECPRPPEMTHSEPTTASSRPFWAPERKSRNSVHTPQADIFSLGCVTLEVALDVPPYGKQEEHFVVQQQRRGRQPAERPIRDLTDTEEQLWDLLEKCWDVPLKRPSAAEFLSTLRTLRPSA